MNEMLTVYSERVDDIPLLIAHERQMCIPDLVDRHFPVHGNHAGLSLGWTASVWLAFILSQGDHRLSHVRGQVEQCLRTLRQCAGQAVEALDFTDDRLADVLTALGDDERCQAFEADLNRSLLRVYDLGAERVRVDSTTASGYWTVTEGGLVQFGHSKDRRPDLPQVKVMVSSLDPLGMPVATQVLGGHRADDQLYIPAMEQVRGGLGRSGLLYIGDTKMGALGTRAFAQAGGDYYLCPLSLTQLPAEQLASYLAPVWVGDQSLMPICRPGNDGTLKEIAQGFELSQTMSAEVDGQIITWNERRLVIRSHSMVERATENLHKRLARAQEQLVALTVRKRGKRRIRELPELRQATEAVLVRHKVTDLIQVDLEESVQMHEMKPYNGRPAQTRREVELRMQVTVRQEAVEATERALGWRVYATNQPLGQLSLEQAVIAYRHQYRIEQGFRRLKGRPLSLSPMYLRDDTRVEGLVRLLSLGLRLLTLLEFGVRQRLAQENAALTGLYVSSPTRAIVRPTAERLLEALKGITLTIIQLNDQRLYHLTPLSELQQRILALANLPMQTYAILTIGFSEPP